MLVDPNTGAPIEEDAPSAQSLTGTVGTSLGAAYGLDPVNHQTFFNVLANTPTALHSAGWNALRGKNTITRGGFSPSITAESGNVRGFLGNNVHPRSWGRFTDASVMNSNTGYSPINFLSGQANKYGTKAIDRLAARAKEAYNAGTSATDSSYKAYQRLYDSGFTSGELFTPGLTSRLLGGRKIARATGEKAELLKGNGLDFIRATNPGMKSALEGVEGLTERQVAGLTMMSAKGKATQAIGGYIAGAGGYADPVVMNLANRSAIEAGEATGMHIGARYAAKATEHLAAGGVERIGGKLVLKETGETGLTAALKGLKIAYKSPIGKEIGEEAVAKGSAMLAAKFGAAVGANAIPVVGQVASAVMTAMMIYDIGQMGMSALGQLPGLAKDAMVSARGQISKPVFGMGYKDNTVAATSRGRGVMAIQNSQLNARNMLGGEAAGMHAHFG